MLEQGANEGGCLSAGLGAWPACLALRSTAPPHAVTIMGLGSMRVVRARSGAGLGAWPATPWPCAALHPHTLSPSRYWLMLDSGVDEGGWLGAGLGAWPATPWPCAALHPHTVSPSRD